MPKASQRTQSGRTQAYLIRLWQDSPDGTWRASAKSVQSGETVLFASLDSLFAFLKTETDVESNDNEQNEN